ncbi:MAG: hypothetical protein KAT68_18090 [Bacteroidales bacterium]|nr:hypothetical protein [Bacteroidales bacterium]
MQLKKEINILTIIPARGGSRGIPRKNLRPLNGIPLIYYSIQTALNSEYKMDVYVSSDDDEILMFAERFGAFKHKRDTKLAKDDTTLDPVIYNAFIQIQKEQNKIYQYVITLQPTSPLLNTTSLDEAISKIIKDENTDVILSAKERKHLSWKKISGKYVPTYKERLNRQYLDEIYEETGAFFICKAENLLKFKKRITGNVDIFILNKEEGIDIDDFDDWALSEYYLRRKKILFVVTGNQNVGLGHVYRSLILAHEILNHEIVFLFDNESKLGFDKLSEYNFKTYIQSHENIIEDIKTLNPHIVINDILDTEKNYIIELKKFGIKIVNFEDVGAGAGLADLVVNALYPEKKQMPNHYFGYEYFCARDEFINSQIKKIAPVKNILISFGGVDTNNYTFKVLEAIYLYCIKNNIKITIVEGIGYKFHNSIKEFHNIDVFKNISNISDFFFKADIILTSAGRTVYEIACIGTPMIILAQNKRELSHLFASDENGFINLGLGTKVSKDQILQVFKNLVNDFKGRQKMNKKMLSFDLKNGKKRTLNLINNIINQ